MQISIRHLLVLTAAAAATMAWIDRFDLDWSDIEPSPPGWLGLLALVASGFFRLRAPLPIAACGVQLALWDSVYKIFWWYTIFVADAGYAIQMSAGCVVLPFLATIFAAQQDLKRPYDRWASILFDALVVTWISLLLHVTAMMFYVTTLP